jgi:hypothetical protein
LTTREQGCSIGACAAALQSNKKPLAALSVRLCDCPSAQHWRLARNCSLQLMLPLRLPVSANQLSHCLLARWPLFLTLLAAAMRSPSWAWGRQPASWSAGDSCSPAPPSTSSCKSWQPSTTRRPTGARVCVSLRRWVGPCVGGCVPGLPSVDH